MRFLVSSVLQRELQDPRIGFVTILRVEPTEDLKEAKVYFSVLGDPAVKSRTVSAMEQARGFIQKEVGKSLRTRSTPRLRFILDESDEKRARMTSLIEDAIREEGESGPTRSGEGESEQPTTGVDGED